MRVDWVAFLLLAGVLAACLDVPEKETDEDEPRQPLVPADWAARAVPFGANHSHRDRFPHENVPTPNFEVVGRNPLVTDYHQATSGDFYCGGAATMGERKIVAATSYGTDIAIVLTDVTNQSDPQVLGEYVLKRGFTYDADITPDAKYVVIGLTVNQNEQPDPPGATSVLSFEWRSRCADRSFTQEEEVPFETGVVLLDIADPTRPTFADFAPVAGRGVHSVFATRIGDEQYVLASSLSSAQPATYFEVFTIQENAVAGPRLRAYGVHSSQYTTPASPEPGGLLNGHVDGWIQKHPATGDVLVYMAAWDGGLLIARLETEGRITTIGTWSDHTFTPGDVRPPPTTVPPLPTSVPPSPPGVPGVRNDSKATGQIHGAFPLPDLVDGKHYTYIGQEVVGRPPGRPTGQVIKLDTTDPTRPTSVARWTMPVDVPAAGWDGALSFSTHYFRVVNGTLFVTLYHGGLWAVGVDPVEGKELPTLGVYIPAFESPAPPPARLGVDRRTPLCLDVFELDGGRLALLDANSGVYVLRFEPTLVLPATPAWTADAWIR